MNDETYVKASELWRVGNITLPVVASAYARASQALGRANGGGDSLGIIYFHWNNLSDQLQTYLADSAETFLDIGDSLILAAESYGYTDDENASKLKEIQLGERADGPAAQEFAPPDRDDIYIQRPGDGEPDSDLRDPEAPERESEPELSQQGKEDEKRNEEESTPGPGQTNRETTP